MNILLDDIPFNNSLYPFAAIRSMVHIRTGILTILEKWQSVFPQKIFLTSVNQNEDIRPLKKIPANMVPSANFLRQFRNDPSIMPSTKDCKTLEYPWQIFEQNDWAI